MSTGYIVTSCDFNIKEGCTFFCPMERNCPKPTAKQFLLLMNNLINLKNAYYHLSHKSSIWREHWIDPYNAILQSKKLVLVFVHDESKYTLTCLLTNGSGGSDNGSL